MSDHGAARDITFIRPVGKKSPRKIFGPPTDGVYPQTNSTADPEKWTRTIYSSVPSLLDAFPIFTAESQKASAFIGDMPRLVADWAAKLRDRDLPQPCEWTGPQTVTLDEATARLDQFVEETTGKTVELFEDRVACLGARRAIEKLKQSGSYDQAMLLAQLYGAYEVAPDWRDEDVTPSDGWFMSAWREPQTEPAVINVTQGVGKTRAGIKIAADAARAGLRVGMLVSTHSLAGEQIGRFAAEGVTAAVWSGETQIGPNGEAACPRHVERTELRRAGLRADMLCGDRARGFCPLRDSCRYRRQRAEVAMADVVLFCGAGTLAAKPPTAFVGADVKRNVLDPTTGKLVSRVTLKRQPRRKRKGRDYLPPIDLILIDEPVWTQLIDAPEADADKGPGVVTVGEMAALAAQLDKDDDTLLPFVQAILARLSGAPGYWTHGDIKAAVADVPGVFWDSRLKAVMRAARKAVEKIEVDPGRDMAASIAKSPVACRNRLLMQAFRIARAMLSAVNASIGAAEDRATPYLVGVMTKGGPILHVRRVSNIHKQWRRAQIVVLDATFRPEIAKRFVPDIAEPLRLDVETPPASMVVAQVFDNQVGVGRLNELLDEAEKAKRKGNPLPRRLRDLVAFVEIAAARVYGRGGKDIDFLVVTIKGLADFIVEHLGDRRPAGLSVWNFNNCRGLDEARGAAGVALIGRPLPAPEAAADFAALLSGVVEPVGQYIQTAGVYQDAKDRRRGYKAEGARSVLPDPFMQTVVDSVCSDALSHAIARLRPVRRPGAEAQSWIITSEPVPNCPVDSFVRLDDALSPGRNPYLLAAARGVAVTPGVKGCLEVLAAVTGMTAAELKHWGKREGAVYARNAHGGQILYRFLNIGIGPRESAETPPGPDGQGAGAISDLGLMALHDIVACGQWIKVRVFLTGGRYSVPCRLRAETLPEARALWSRATGRDPSEVQPAIEDQKRAAAA